MAKHAAGYQYLTMKEQNELNDKSKRIVFKGVLPDYESINSDQPDPARTNVPITNGAEDFKY